MNLPPRLLGAAACLGVFASVFTASLPAFGQAWPSRPLRMIVPFPPGGPTDITGRTLAQKLAERWNQPVVVENRPGAGSIIGTEIAAKAAPDGYTMLLGSNSIALQPLLQAKLPYDPQRDLAPVILAVRIPNVLIVHPSVPANTMAEFIALARAKPGSINYASVGNATGPHLFGELFRNMTGVDIVHVPYKGTAPAVTDLLAGQVQALFDSLATALPNIRAGKLRALGVTSLQRSKSAPDIPSISESGVTGYEATGWFGVLVPAGTPGEIVARMNAEIGAILKQPDVEERFLKFGAEGGGGTPEQFAAFIRSEQDKWGKVIREARIRID
ncbi:MAG: tripartite tricarboxylate transporter substrate binding protein [Betaproteobacteria bacterium]|nr:tripartite tricarboxylate transporter substrate binding protein [Betaproteobacteria bacterium]